jgi:hypothetical protein
MYVSPADIDELVRRIERLEVQIALLNVPSAVATHYSVAQFAEKVGRACYTVREWARLGRIESTRRAGRGPYREYVISHSELTRYLEQGLRRENGTEAAKDD